MLRAKYKVDSKWLQARLVALASFSWRGLEGVRSHLSKEACLLVGNGNNILVWRDPWVPDLPSFSPLPCDSLEAFRSLSVADLMSQDKRS